MGKKRKVSIYDDRYRDLIETIKHYRKEQGISQTQIAEQTGIPQYDISKIETFVRRIDAVELHDYLNALNIDFDLLKTIQEKIQKTMK